MPPTIRSIRAGDDEDFASGQHPFAPGTSSFEDGLRQAQAHYDSYGQFNPAQWRGMTLQNGRVVDGRSWWEKNNWWAIPAIVTATAGVGSAFAGPAAAAGGSGAGAAGAIAPSVEGATALSAIPPAVSAGGVGGAYGASALAPLVEGATATHAVPPAVSAAGGGGASGLVRPPNVTSDRVNGGASDWLDPRTLAALGLGGASAIQGLRQPQGVQDLKDLFGLAKSRSEQAGPLYDSLLRMTQAQLPKYARGEQ